MPQSVRPVIEVRREQMFPVLEPEEIDRLARFGERRSSLPACRAIWSNASPHGRTSRC
jgi:hypothetical protein